jgi:FKBP-type peptidyl-prolyl cis-trans isomerase FklB
MKRVVLMVVGLCAMSAMICAQDTSQPAAAPAAGGPNDSPVASYGIGMNIGRGMRADGMQIQIDAFIQGLRDGLEGAQPKYPEGQLRAAFDALRQQMQAKQEQLAATVGDKNKREGEAFLANNKAAPGVKVTNSGLQYQVLQAGTGASPKASDTVRVHYHGTLLDGKVFDSSVKRGEPAEFPVDGVIPGWTEALQLMKVGDKWRLFIPAELAYGARGAGNMIGPNAVLVFEVELLDVKPTAGR